MDEEQTSWMFWKKPEQSLQSLSPQWMIWIYYLQLVFICIFLVHSAEDWNIFFKKNYAVVMETIRHSEATKVNFPPCNLLSSLSCPVQKFSLLPLATPNGCQPSELKNYLSECYLQNKYLFPCFSKNILFLNRYWASSLDYVSERYNRLISQYWGPFPVLRFTVCFNSEWSKYRSICGTFQYYSRTDC